MRVASRRIDSRLRADFIVGSGVSFCVIMIVFNCSAVAGHTSHTPGFVLFCCHKAIIRR